MKDQFEIFLKDSGNNTAEPFTDKEVVWKGIEQNLHRKKTRRLFTKIGIAASILILLGTGSLFLRINENPKHITDYYSEISTELSETEFYFASLIEEKQKQIKNEGSFNKQLFQSFIEELDELDKQYEGYKKEMGDFGYQEELIRAMIENQREKLEILNRFLSEIKKIKNYENRKKEYHI
jgi:hypothetical protein